MEKRYQYWGFKDGKPQILWTKWFTVREKGSGVQHKSLKNEYRDA